MNGYLEEDLLMIHLDGGYLMNNNLEDQWIG